MTQILNTAVKLGIAEHLSGGARSTAQLAVEVGAEERALRRFLRMMVALGLLAQGDGDEFALTPAGARLASDRPDSVTDRVRWIGEVSYPTAQAMLYAVQTGKPAFECVFGVPFFAYLAQRPELGRVFDRLMAQEVEQRSSAIVASYDFSDAGTIVDIGGGNGAMLSAILRAHRKARGIVFDIPAVVADARKQLRESDIGSRIELAGGDVFSDALPQDADVYILSHVIHDWSDVQAKEILRKCAGAMGARGRLLIVEELLPERVADATATIANDFNMLLLTGGAERTEAEYNALADAAGLRVCAVVAFETDPVHGGRRSNWAILECRTKEHAA